MISHVIPSLVWVAWPVWAEEGHVVLSVVPPVVFTYRMLLHMHVTHFLHAKASGSIKINSSAKQLIFAIKAYRYQ